MKKLSEQNVPGYHLDGQGGFNQNKGGGAFLSTNQDGSEATPNFSGHAQHLPGTDMTIPTDDSGNVFMPMIHRKSTIRIVDTKRNPIFVFLDDGTRLHFTYDEFKRIKGGEPAPGKTMTVVFQKNPNDRTEVPSQVQSCKVE